MLLSSEIAIIDLRFFIFSLFQDAFKTIEREEKEMSNGAFVQESRGGDRK